MLDSLLGQVDWLEVASKVAKNRAPFVYCNVVEKVLLGHTYQLVKAESQDGNASKPKTAKTRKVTSVIGLRKKGKIANITRAFVKKEI